MASCTTCAGYGPLAQRGALVVAASGAELIAVDLERGSERWRSAMRGGVGVGALAIVGSRVLAAGDGTGVRRTERHPIDAVDIQSGRTLDWGPTVTVGAGGRMRPGAIGDFEPVADGVLLCGGFDRVGGRRRVGLALVGDDGNVRPWRRDVLPGCTRARPGHGRIAVNQLFDVPLVPAPRIG